MGWERYKCGTWHMVAGIKGKMENTGCHKKREGRKNISRKSLLSFSSKESSSMHCLSFLKLEISLNPLPCSLFQRLGKGMSSTEETCFSTPSHTEPQHTPSHTECCIKCLFYISLILGNAASVNFLISNCYSFVQHYTYILYIGRSIG